LQLDSGDKPIGKDVYARLKAVEDKILFLEGISPEYFSKVVIKIKNSPLISEIDFESGIIHLNQNFIPE
jgi:hypothetical protein